MNANLTASDPAVQPSQKVDSKGLTTEVALKRLQEDGPNTISDTSDHPLRNALAKFWAPVPWLLEASILLELVLQKYFEAAIIAGLLVFNAALAFVQESHAQATPRCIKNHAWL